MYRHIKHEHKTPLSLEFLTKEYNSMRRAKIILLLATFNKYHKFATMPQKQKEEIVSKIESGCLRHAHEKAMENDTIVNWENDSFADIYHSICFRITTNLDPELVHNEAFCHRILSGEIPYDSLSKLSSQEIFPEQYKDVMEKMNKSKQVSTAVKTSSLYRCGRCKENKCIIESVINRSIDEGASIKVTCANCGMWWFA
jgi:DNA-directed RNA polymerase subunit M/transcription elongation factor TFIIS